ncbi:hypothetical protein [Paenibacillus kribbensis]
MGKISEKYVFRTWAFLNITINGSSVACNGIIILVKNMVSTAAPKR